MKYLGFPNQFPIAWENEMKSIELEEPEELVPIPPPSPPPTYGYFSSIRFPERMGTFLPSYGILFPLISKKHGKMQQNPPCELSGCFSTVWLFLLVPKSGNSLKEQTEKNNQVNSFFLKIKKKSIPGTLEFKE